MEGLTSKKEELLRLSKEELVDLVLRLQAHLPSSLPDPTPVANNKRKRDNEDESEDEVVNEPGEGQTGRRLTVHTSRS